ncbi:MAG: DNA repair protein RecO [Elusimicrobiaceae bacterium]|nr:DNA repair protein RecO [Elusimicrobiaceae bacterium]
MNFSDSAVVLVKRDIREADRIVSVYTRSRGRMNLRFPGVNRPLARLKAITEPFVCSDIRIYMRAGSCSGVATGGKINSVFPKLRRDARKTRLALHFCELMYRMTPELQINEDKFFLLVNVLEFLETNEPVPSTRAAFTFRLMRLAGFGLSDPVLGISRQFWDRLHEADFAALDFASPAEKEELLKSEYVISRFIARTFPQGIRTAEAFENPRYAQNLSL